MQFHHLETVIHLGPLITLTLLVPSSMKSTTVIRPFLTAIFLTCGVLSFDHGYAAEGAQGSAPANQEEGKSTAKSGKKNKAKKKKKEKQKPEIAKIGIPAGPLDGMTIIKGDPVTLEKGKIYVVEFWATWCGPCIKGIPHLTKLQAKYADKGVTVIGITNESDLNKVKGFVEKQGDKMAYTVAMDPERKVAANYMQAYQRRGIPSAFLVDREGKMVWVGHPKFGMDEVLEMLAADTFDVDAYTKAQNEKAELRKKAGVITGSYFKALRKGTPMEEARPIAEKLFELNSPEILITMVWEIHDLEEYAEEDEPTIPCDHELALKLAAKADADTGGKDPAALDAHAMGLAKTGQLEQAIVLQEKALELMPEDHVSRKYMVKQLDEFKKNLAKQKAE